MTQHEADVLYAQGQVIITQRLLDRILDVETDWSTIEVVDATHRLTRAQQHLVRVASVLDDGQRYQRS